ncbi:MAG: M20/M25/M40 family metallo-hydrolase [Geminicoccaceae bacterium]
MAHGCMPFLGDSASLHMAAFITALENDLLPAIQTRETELPIIPAAARRASINLALLRAGTFGAGDDLPTPVVPDRATLVLDRRYLPEEDIDQVEAELDELIGKVSRQRPNFAATRREIMHFPPVMTEITAPTVRAASAAIETVYGKPARLVASPGTYDHKHFATIAGITDCIAYGPGQLDLAHQPDEYVEIEDLVGAAKVMAVSLAMLLGIESR